MLQMCSFLTQDCEEQKVFMLFHENYDLSDYKASLYSFKPNQITCSLSDG